MGYPTPIEWTDATWNPVGGCSIASPGCIKCYAQQLAGTRLARHPLYRGTTTLTRGVGGAAAREKTARPVFNGTMTALPPTHDGWDFPLTWRGVSRLQRPRLGWGMPSMIFCGDMSDLFHERRDVDHIAKVFARAALSRHILQVLTKRSGRMRELLTDRRFRQQVQDAVDDIRRERVGWWAARASGALKFPLPNVWVGVSAERQQEADRRRDDLATLAVAGWLTFVSYEPALGPVNFDGWQFLSWLISGGEKSRREPRPSHPDWHRAARDFCAEHGIAYFLKQWGSWGPTPYGLAISEHRGNCQPTVAWPDGTIAFGLAAEHGGNGVNLFCGDKDETGHLLDGVEHRGFPAIAARLRIGAAA